MAELDGELIPEPRPNEIGSWAYRVLSDGTLLRTELTSNERRQLDDQRLRELNAAIQKMNQHPLNMVALELLREAKSGPVQCGGLSEIHLLSLVTLALVEDDDNDTTWERYAEYAGSFESMKAALSIIEGAVITPEELAEYPPLAAAQLLAEILRIFR